MVIPCVVGDQGDIQLQSGGRNPRISEGDGAAFPLTVALDPGPQTGCLRVRPQVLWSPSETDGPGAFLTEGPYKGYKFFRALRIIFGASLQVFGAHRRLEDDARRKPYLAPPALVPSVLWGISILSLAQGSVSEAFEDLTAS